MTGTVLLQIAELLSRRLEIRNKISAALVYPVILVLMSLVSIAVIAFVLIPSISPIFTDANMPLPGILNTFESLQDNWVMVVASLSIAAMGFALLWRSLKHNAEVMLGIDRFMSALPMAGQLIHIREAGRFARALGTLHRAGVPLMTALQTSRKLVTNRYLNVRYGEVIARIPEGSSLSRAFDGTALLPPTSLRLIAVGEESGQLAPMLLQLATVLESDLQRRIERLVGLLTPVMTLVIGGSVGALIMQVMSAVLSINDLAFQ